MARGSTKSRRAGGASGKRKRADQRRSRATRLSILKAALSEFAEKGFEAASIRSIAERTGLQHPLITYHYPTKDALWRTTAEYAFEQIREKWDKSGSELSDAAPIDHLRAEYRTVFYYTAAFPEFHRFMRQEAMYDNPRLRWVAETMLAGFGPEMRITSRVSPQAPAVIDSYWMQVENMVFGRFTNASGSRDRKLAPKRGT